RRDARGAAHQVEGVLDVLAGERLPIVPAHALAQREHEAFAVVAPRPFLRQLADDGGGALLPAEGAKDHEVVVARHYCPVDGDRGFFMDAEAGRILAVHRVEDAAHLRSRTGSPGGRYHERGEDHTTEPDADRTPMHHESPPFGATDRATHPGTARN